MYSKPIVPLLFHVTTILKRNFLSPLNRGLLANIDDKTGLSWSKQLKIEDTTSKFLRDADEYLVSALKEMVGT
jgi:hypothetical protein